MCAARPPVPPPADSYKLSDLVAQAASSGEMASGLGMTVASVAAYLKAAKPVSTIQQEATLSQGVKQVVSFDSATENSEIYYTIGSNRRGLVPSCGSKAATGSGNPTGILYVPGRLLSFSSSSSIQAVTCAPSMLPSDSATVEVLVPTEQPMIQTVSGCQVSTGCQQFQISPGLNSSGVSGYTMWYTLDLPRTCFAHTDCGKHQTCHTGYCLSDPECSSSGPSGSARYSAPVTVTQSYMASAVACASGLSKSAVYTLALSVPMSAPILQFSPFYPRKLLQVTHPQQQQFGFQIWYRATTGVFNASWEDTDLSCTRKGDSQLLHAGAVCEQHHSDSCVWLREHSAVQAVACAPLATTTTYNYTSLTVQAAPPTATMDPNLTGPWVVNLVTDPGLKTFWLLSNLSNSSSLLTCNESTRHGTAKQYLANDISTHPKIVDRLNVASVKHLHAISCAPARVLHSTMVSASISQAVEPAVSFDASSLGLAMQSQTSSHLGVDAFVAYSMGTECRTTKAPSCRASETGHLIKVFEHAAPPLLQTRLPPFARQETAYTACVKAVTCRDLTIPSAVVVTPLVVPHELPPVELRHRVSGTMQLVGYNAATFTDTEKAQLVSGLAQHLMVLESRISVTSVTRRSVLVEYLVLAESLDQANAIVVTVTTIQTTPAALQATLQQLGLNSLSGVTVLSVSVVSPTPAPSPPILDDWMWGLIGLAVVVFGIAVLVGVRRKCRRSNRVQSDVVVTNKQASDDFHLSKSVLKEVRWFKGDDAAPSEEVRQIVVGSSGVEFVERVDFDDICGGTGSIMESPTFEDGHLKKGHDAAHISIQGWAHVRQVVVGASGVEFVEPVEFDDICGGTGPMMERPSVQDGHV